MNKTSKPKLNTTGLHAVKMLKISVTSDPKEKILEEIGKYLQLSNYPINKLSNYPINPFVIVTPNPEQIVLAQKDPHFRDILNQADVAIPDGIGIIWALRIFASTHQRINASTNVQRISGVEMMEDLVAMAAIRGVAIGLIGGRGGLAVRALECLQKKHPSLAGWTEDGPEVDIKYPCLAGRQEISNIKNSNQKSIWKQFEQCIPSISFDRTQDRSLGVNNVPMQQCVNGLSEQYISRIIRKIVETNTRMVFVGLGAPKQEYVIESLCGTWYAVCGKQDTKNSASRVPHPASPLILMSVGGAFDEISGRLPKPPVWLDRMGFKWLWRLILEPRRWRRQLALVKFIYLVMKERYTSI